MRLHYLISTTILLTLSGPALGAGHTLAEEIKSFNGGNYSEAAACGAEIVRLNPADATARYYFAQALVKLNRKEEAIAQFSKCYNTTKNQTMKSYCYTALQTLLSNSPGGKTSQTNSSASTTSSSSAANGPGAAPPPLVKPAPDATHNIDASTQARKMQILEAGAKDIEIRRAQLNIDLQHAKELAAEQMQGIPEFFERPVFQNGYRIGVQRVENLEYKQALMQSQKELADKTQQVTKEFECREAEITADCKNRASAYEQVSSNLKSQQQAGNSQIQLLPQNSSIYVRHFINYDGNTAVGIKTRQKARPLKKALVTNVKKPAK